ncbi:hypothetical protein [uncultured Ligilactobacillus sp.]|nr:hypothetical protein [uncultured Ligilactobacillus sp.]
MCRGDTLSGISARLGVSVIWYRLTV